jgi:hypothetical protein
MPISCLFSPETESDWVALSVPGSMSLTFHISSVVVVNVKQPREFGMRYNEVMADDSSSNPMTTSLESSENPFPSPIPEESNGNSLDSEILSMHSRFRPRSHKRRHTVSDVQQDLAHAHIDLSDNRYRDLIRTRKTSIPE